MTRSHHGLQYGLKRGLIFSTCCLFSLLLSAPLPAADDETATEGDAAGAASPATPTTPAPTLGQPDSADSASVRTEARPDLARLQELVKSSSPETEVIWLETSSDRTIGLYHPYGLAEPRGGVLIFHGEGTHADWPDYARPLRLHLSDQGWHTLSVQLPTPPTLAVPERTLPVLQLVKPGQPTVPPPQVPEPTTNNQPETPYSMRMQELASNAANALIAKGASQIVAVGVGTGAVWAAQFVRDYQEQLSVGLLMINPATPNVDSSPKLESLLAELSMPVVDLYQGEPGATSEFEAPPKQRRRWARRFQLPYYMQRRINIRYRDWEKQERWLSQQVDGMIRRHIAEPLESMVMKKEKEKEQVKQETGPGQRPKPI